MKNDVTMMRVIITSFIVLFTSRSFHTNSKSELPASLSLSLSPHSFILFFSLFYCLTPCTHLFYLLVYGYTTSHFFTSIHHLCISIYYYTHFSIHHLCICIYYSLFSSSKLHGFFCMTS